MLDAYSQHTFCVCAYKESPYLEACLQSLKQQSIQSRILIATSTPNAYINGIAEKYNVPVFINEGEKGIGGDWNYALSCSDTPLVTIAHQDDIYCPRYTEQMIKRLQSCKTPILYFCGYGEIRDGLIITDNKLLKIKKWMLLPLRPTFMQKSIFVRRVILSFGNPICCPSVTYIKSKMDHKAFDTHFACDLDWDRWERSSKQKGAFVYHPDVLVLHRIHQDSETSNLIVNNIRSNEDFEMFRRFWPRRIAILLSKLYGRSQKSNSLTKKG